MRRRRRSRRAHLRSTSAGKLLGKDLLLAKLGNLVYQAEGVENYRFSSPAEDMAVESPPASGAGQL
jgi:hypothetical protein